MSELARMSASEDDLLNSFPLFCGSDRNVAMSVFEFVHGFLTKRTWSAERIRLHYGRRTVVDILEDGDVLAVAPCPDRTLVAAAMLIRNGIEPVVVYHERRALGFGPSTAHLAMELTLDGLPFMADFGSRESRFMRGTYEPNSDIEATVQIVRFSTAALELDLGAVSPSLLFGALASEHIDTESYLAYLIRESAKFPVGHIISERMAFDAKFSIQRDL
ncbi:hypothetical protein ABZ319_34915 [Nocardia sp. NPDC005978]|uniref:hypothetical protein n=1 Tax=Nocardia sp. NPDC005978 TaxID=3156725 RepID=UPI0033AA6779